MRSCRLWTQPQSWTCLYLFQDQLCLFQHFLCRPLTEWSTHTHTHAHCVLISSDSFHVQTECLPALGSQPDVCLVMNQKCLDVWTRLSRICFTDRQQRAMKLMLHLKCWCQRLHAASLQAERVCRYECDKINTWYHASTCLVKKIIMWTVMERLKSNTGNKWLNINQDKCSFN